jgi:hypothetical protein
MCCLITREGRGYFEMLPESQVSARVEGTFPSTSVRSMPGINTRQQPSAN